LANVWKKIFSAKDATNYVQAIAEFNGKLYICASCEPSKSAFIYRIADNECKKWQNVTPSWSPNTRDIGGLVVFKGPLDATAQLYVGTDMGEVFRTADGLNWNDVSGSLPKNQSIKAMHEFKDHLYVASWSWMFRTSNGKSWTRVDEGLFSGAKRRVESLEEFDNYLYAGVGMDNNNGIQIWRTDGSNDGKNWKYFKDMYHAQDPNWPYAAGHVHALKTFNVNKKLYIGRYEGHGLWYTDGLTKPDGTALNWDYVDAIPAGDVHRLEEHNGKLYLGVKTKLSLNPQTPLLFESVDGQNWNISPVSPKCSVTTNTIGALTSVGNKLYVGMGGTNSDGLAEVWELGPPILADAHEPNNNLQDATIVDLGLAVGKAVKFTDLTLLNGDVDFFEVRFKSQQGDCVSSFKQDLGFGIVGKFYPGNIAISVKEEYCNDLFFEVYDANKTYVGSFKNEATFTCPIQKFKGEKFFVCITSLPAGSQPVRYRLYISQNDWRATLGRPTFEIGEIRKMPIDIARPFEFVSRIAKEALEYSDPNDLIKDVERYLPKFIEYRSAIDTAYLKYGIGQFAHKIGRFNEAEKFYRSSLASFEELGIESDEADVLYNLGELLAAQEKMNEAISLLERAAHLHKKIEDTSGLSQDRLALGRYYLIKGEANKSLFLLQEAWHAQILVPDLSGIALNLLYQSEAFLSLKKDEVAVACVVLAEEFSSRIEDIADRQEVNRQLNSFHKLITANLGEQKLVELKKSLSGKAEGVWYRELLRVGREK
jgi:tetratricopeptide (TPR) repeat protein